MKKCSSIVWRFFDRIEENKRCVGVLCKLCETQYKYFGNTTNLRTHLINKHPIQWELTQNGTLDEATIRAYEDEETNQSVSSSRRRKYTKAYKDKNVGYSISVDLNKSPGDQLNSTDVDSLPRIEIHRVDILENSETENDRQGDSEANEATIHLVSQMNRGSDEEWLEEENFPTYEPKHKKMKYRRIKREVESPPHRMSNYVIHNPTKFDNSDHILLENVQHKDEYSVFGEYVANKLRKFKTPRTRGNIQQLITTILWQAEYGLYDNADAVKKVLMYTVQDTGSTQEHIQTEIISKDGMEEPNQSAETDSLSLIN